MRLAYLHCFAGISGDMFLGALLGAGVPRDVLSDAVAALGIGASLAIETVDRSGISALKVHVLEHGTPAEDADRGQSHPEETGDILPHQGGGRGAALTEQPKTQHLHKTGHAHVHAADVPLHSHGDGAESASQIHVHPHALAHGDHGKDDAAHGHVHGRSLTQIRALIGGAPLAEPVKRFALAAFELLGTAEAKIHNVPVDTIHFHEVGGVDAIADIVAASAGIHHLGVASWHCSPVNVGGGTVRCAHGTFPVPAPATADLLRGLPTYSAHVEQELVTPTGAALLRALAPKFGTQPAMEIETIGYGAGSRDPHGFPNVLRLSVGEASGEGIVAATGALAAVAGEDAPPAPARPLQQTHKRQTATVTVLETALDDLSPQLVAYAVEQALAAGALDVMLTPVVMKKGRPGTLLTVLCEPGQSEALQALLLRETSTLGVRVRQEQRTCLRRRHTTVETAYGPIRIKIGFEGEAELNAAPEFEDCRSAAQAHSTALKQVQQAAMAAYLGRAAR